MSGAKRRLSDAKRRIISDIYLAHITANLTLATEKYTMQIRAFGKEAQALAELVGNLSAATKEKN